MCNGTSDLCASLSLTTEDLVRYSRQISLPHFGEEGQRKLKKAHVVVAGIGGLGCPAAIYLACSGVGKLTLIDSDRVELSNLNRQILHWEKNIGEEKVLSAARKVREINSGVEIAPISVRITAQNARQLISGADLVIDGMDNMETRFILNEACYKEKIPFIHGGVSGLRGEITTIIPDETPCLECIFSRSTGTGKSGVPVLGAAPALISSLQVMEALKLISGFGKPLTGRMLLVNGETMEFMVVERQKKPNCPVCGS